MDTLPPVSPPAIVQRVDQIAVDAHQRIIGMRTWLTEQHDAMPILPEAPVASDRRGITLALNLYWSQLVELEPGRKIARIDAFQTKLASAMLDVATLRHADGTLDDDAYALAKRVTSHAYGDDVNVDVRTITLGDKTYAGAFLAIDRRRPYKVIVFASDHGWMAFASIDEAHTWMEAHLRHTLRWRTDLPGLSRKDIETDAAVGSTSIEGPVAEAMTKRWIAVQKDKINLAWFQDSLDDTSSEETDSLVDELKSAFDLTDVFDVDALLAQGDLLLIKDAASERLDRLPVVLPGGLALDDLWRQADIGYFSTRKAVDRALLDSGLDHELPELYDYTAIRLREGLRSLGITTDPRQITVTWDRSNPIASAVDVLTTWSTTPTARMSLIELACSNVPELHLGQLSATDGDGQPLPQLSNAALWALVRTIDIGGSYPSVVESGLRSGVDGQRRKEAAMLTAIARMRFEAINAYVGAVLGENTLHRDIALSERGWRWIDSVLDQPSEASRRPVHGKVVEARQVVYDGAPLQGVIEIGLKELSWAEPAAYMGSLVYYTPNAPDGVTFREYRSREEADRRFFRNPEFIDYLLDRLPADVAEVPDNSRRRRFKAPYGTMWVFNTHPPEGVTPMGGQFASRAISENIIERMYDTTVDQVLRDVRIHARSTALADDQSAVDLFAHHAFGAPLAPRLAVAAVTAPFVAAPAAWRAYDHVKDGHYDQAFVDATEAYTTGLGAAGIAGALARGTTSAVNMAKFRARFRPWDRPVSSPVSSTSSSGDASPSGLFRITDRPIVPGNEPTAFDHVLVAVEGNVYHIPRFATGSHIEVTTARTVRRSENRAIRQWQRDMRAARRQAERKRLDEHARSDSSSMDDMAWRNAHNTPDSFDRFVDAMKESFPDRLERQQIVDNALASQATGLRSLTVAQREGLLAAQRKASTTSRSGGTSATDASMLDLPPPAGYQRVGLSELPPKLWYYERKTFHPESLVNLSAEGQDLMLSHKARLIGDLQNGGRYGIRLTSADPSLPSDDLVAGTQVVPFFRRHTRAVELDIRSIVLGRRPQEVLYDLYERPGSGVRRKHYLLLPRQGRDIELKTREFTLLDNLPPHKGGSGTSLSSLDAP